MLDLGGVTARLEGERWHKVNIPDDLAGSIKLVTDYQGSRFGVESIIGQATDYAPIIEKQLRDEGVIDDLTGVIIHSASRNGAFARVLYTAVPNEVNLKYKAMAQAHSDFLFVYPLPAVLLEFARRSNLYDGALLFVYGNQVAVLALRAGQVIAADRLQYTGSLSLEGARIAQRIWSMCQDSSTEVKAASLSFLVSHVPGLAASEVAGLCAALEDCAHKSPAEFAAKVTRMEDHSVILADLPFSIGEIPPLDRGLYYCRRAVPWLTVGLAMLLLVALAVAGHWYSQRNMLEANLGKPQTQLSGGVSEQLARAVADAEQLDPELKRIRKLLDARERARLIPALPDLLSDISAAASDNVIVSMVGAVSSEEGGLVSITFSGKSLENSFESERVFIRELENRGYKVVKREVDSSITMGGMFKLSIIRSR